MLSLILAQSECLRYALHMRVEWYLRVEILIFMIRCHDERVRKVLAIHKVRLVKRGINIEL